MSHKSKEVLNSLAKTAADGFLKNQKPMNDSLKKIASAEGLEPHHIEYVAGEANKMVWASHYKNDKKAAYDFPLADPKAVIEDLQIKPVEKVAEVSLDYMVAPSREKTASDRSIMGEFSTEATSQDERRELKHKLTQRYEKLAQAQQDTAAEMIVVRSTIETLENKFVKEAREMIMQTPFTERAAAMDKIAEFVRGAGHVEKGRALMQKLAQKIVKDGLVKQADMRAPEEYISEGLPARIINGNHSLYVTLDTIVKKEEHLVGMQRNYIICDDTLPVLREKIRGL